MTKFLCVDFDATLSDPQMSQFIKDTVETKKREGIEDLKIGIVTSRSIYDDFKTYGQFHHEIPYRHLPDWFGCNPAPGRWLLKYDSVA